MMKKSKSVLALLLALLMLFAFAACGPGGKDPAPSDGDEPGDRPLASAGQDVGGHNEDATITEKPEGIQPGTTFKFWTNTDYPKQMPWMDNYANQLQYQLYDNLLYRYHGDIDDVRGNIAESWEVSEDGLTWVFQIKDDVYFTSGNQVTAEAFVKTWDAAQPYQPRYFASVESYEATSELELTIKLSSAIPTFIYELPMQPAVGVVDPELLDQYGPEDNQAAVGCGPYYIEEYISGERIILKANPNYHNPDKAPSIETCTIEVIPELNTAMIALMGGQLDCINTNDAEVVNSLLEAGWELAPYENRAFPWWMNAGQVELFKDDVVREALCHLIDWDAVNELAHDGRYSKPNSLWAGPGEYPFDESYDYDPDLGIQMLTDAGYKLDDIAFTVVVNPTFVAEMTAVIGQLTDLGFNNIVMETYDPSTCLGMMKDGTFPVTATHNGYSLENPLGPYDMGLATDSVQHVMTLDVVNPEAYEEAMGHLEAAHASTNYDDYLKEVEQITRILQENHVSFGGLQQISYYAVAEEFSGIYIPPVLGYLEFCYVYSNVG